LNRRDLVRWLGLGAVTHAARRTLFAHADTAHFGAASRSASPSFDPDVELSLSAAPGEASILPGAATRVWRFTGSVLRGPPDSLQAVPDSYLGPTIRLRRGQRVRIRFTNQLPGSTIVHWHGLDVPALMDGHPRLAIAAGDEYVYEFEVSNRAGTYWYHPHPDLRTGPQVYQGLAGLLVVSHDEESALRLPSGEAELVCILQDRQFDAQNQLMYLGGGMMDQMQGFLGDQMLVNGKLRPTMSLATRAYRIRLLNGSNARIYKLRWSDGTPMTVIGGDGGLLEQPVRQRYLTLAPAQRADVILDLSTHAVGATLALETAAYAASEVSMSAAGMGGMMRPSAVPNGTARSLMTLDVARRERAPWVLPTRLSTFDAAWDRPADGPMRRITLEFRQMQWLLGGRTFGMLDVAEEETVPAGSTRIWELANVGGMMGMSMAHPIHIHGRQFRVLSRQRANGAVPPPGSVREGLIDAGWRDTVLVLPGDTVRLQMHFTEHPGLYLYHCHILEHEDAGMMRNFKVV
jgi:FtsP/CotA-like multicopper oxidase with cupredoxin domain